MIKTIKLAYSNIIISYTLQNLLVSIWGSPETTRSSFTSSTSWWSPTTTTTRSSTTSFTSWSCPTTTGSSSISSTSWGSPATSFNSFEFVWAWSRVQVPLSSLWRTLQVHYDESCQIMTEKLATIYLKLFKHAKGTRSLQCTCTLEWLVDACKTVFNNVAFHAFNV